MSEMLWISVPSGKESDAVLRVLIAPRLDGTSLESDGMEHWPPPSLISAMLDVDFSDALGGEIHTLKVNPLIQAEPGIWESFFGPNTVVTPPGRRNKSLGKVMVDSTSTKAEAINHTFTKVAKTPFRLNHDDRPNLDNAVSRELKDRWSGEEQPIPPPPPFKEDKTCLDLPDFHKTISMLREHPAVLRSLGLIMELRIPVSELHKSFSEGILRVRWPDVPASIPKIVSPWTKYDKGFMPGSTTNINSGMVTLTDDNGEPIPADNHRWEVVTFEVDNSAKKLRDAARTLAASSDNVQGTADIKPFMMPALKTAGLTLLRRGRQADFAARRLAANSNARNSMSNNVLTADDLVLGYRIDIKEEGRNYWSSLHQRDAIYKVNDKEFTIGGREEGHIKAHAAIIDGHDMLRADEVIACWRGWSLAVPLPSLYQPANRTCPNMPFKFDWKFSVPEGTLPRLRFAHNYQLRARVADIAGGGLKVNDPAANHYFTELVQYRRYEPIAPPELILPPTLDPKKLSPGETINQLVIRSDFDSDVSEFNSNARRLLFTPKTSLTMSEQHKALDDMTPEEIRQLLKQALAHDIQNAPSSLDEVLLPDFAAAGVCFFPRPEPGGPSGIRTEQRAWSEQWPDFRPMEIVLRERSAANSNILEWEESSDPSLGDRLIVRLAKAEEVTLELSSFLKADFLDHFAIYDLLPIESETEAAVRKGRHPMVTPLQAVTLTHAVPRPLRSPGSLSNSSETLKVLRDKGQTFALLDPVPFDLGVDSKSTAKLEITAKWTEQMGSGIDQPVNVPVQSIIINSGEDRIQNKIHHEFGDTRHRNITYTLTAVSRFKQFFKQENEELYVTKTELPVSIPSSAPPPPLIVISTRPALVWEENCEEGSDFILNRHRLGGHLRIELKGPWYDTGEDEELAVLVWNDNNPPKEMWPFITQAGSDFTQKTLSPKRWPSALDFTLASGAPQEVYLNEAKGYVMAVPHKPWFKDKRCFVDIAIPSLVTESYMPFLRLAVARYQRNSLKDLELSSVVMTEMVQLLPDRTLRVRRHENSVFVSLYGLCPLGGDSSGYDLNQWEVQLEQFSSPPGIDIGSDTVDLTSLEPSTDGIPAWVPIANQRFIGRMDRTWGPREIEIRIPTGLVGPLRLRIQEKEVMSGYVWEAGPGGDLEAHTVYSDVVILPEI